MVPSLAAVLDERGGHRGRLGCDIETILLFRARTTCAPPSRAHVGNAQSDKHRQVKQPLRPTQETQRVRITKKGLGNANTCPKRSYPKNHEIEFEGYTPIRLVCSCVQRSTACRSTPCSVYTFVSRQSTRPPPFLFPSRCPLRSSIIKVLAIFIKGATLDAGTDTTDISSRSS